MPYCTSVPPARHDTAQPIAGSLRGVAIPPMVLVHCQEEGAGVVPSFIAALFPLGLVPPFVLVSTVSPAFSYYLVEPRIGGANWRRGRDSGTRAG